jgi:amino acid permease
MSTPQIITILIIAILITISFFVVVFSKKESFRIASASLWISCSAILILLVVLMTSEKERLLIEKQKNFPCPKYEIIEHNVYRLKK